MDPQLAGSEMGANATLSLHPGKKYCTDSESRILDTVACTLESSNAWFLGHPYIIRKRFRGASPWNLSEHGTMKENKIENDFSNRMTIILDLSKYAPCTDVEDSEIHVYCVQHDEQRGLIGAIKSMNGQIWALHLA